MANSRLVGYDTKNGGPFVTKFWKKEDKEVIVLTWKIGR